MADKTVGDLPEATALNDESLLVMEQNGEAQKIKGKVIKDWVAPYAESAQSAYAGVKQALDNLPEGDTLIVNDLTTGGVSAALSAEMGKLLGAHANRHATGGADPITPSMIGALPVKLTDCRATSVKGVTETGRYYCWNCTDLPPVSPYGFLEVFVHPTDPMYRHLKYTPATEEGSWECSTFDNGATWTDWKRLATTDYVDALTAADVGAAPSTHASRHASGGADPITPALIGALNKAGDTMTGNLNFQMADNGYGQVYKVHNASSDFGFTVKDVDKAGNTARLIVQANNQKAFFVDKNDSYYTILHEGNKPYGSYTGNGSAASRTINTGGISGIVVVWTSSYIAFVVPGGAVIFAISSGAVTGLAYSEAKCNAGVITLATTNAGLNANGITYYYQVL